MSSDERLDSWKEIAGYLKRGVRTAQRWEQTAGLPVRRVASERGGVYAFRSELDSWWQTQSAGAAHSWPVQSFRSVDSPATGAARISDGPPPRSARSPERVRSFLSHAIDIDPDSAPAHANMAVYFFTLVPMGLSPPGEGMPAARAAAQRAIDLDPGNAEAHALAAIVSAHYDRDWQDAGRHLEIALASRPVSPTVRFHSAVWYLSPLERYADALDQLAQGLRDDPLYLLGRVHVAMDLLSLDRPERGLAELDRVLDIDPQFGPALGLLGREYALSGRVEDAVSLAERTRGATPRHPNGTGFLAGMLRRTGDLDRSRHLLESFERESAWCAPRAHAESHIVCNEFAAAADWIAKAVDHRDPGVWLLFAGTAGRLLRSTTKWSVLRQKLNLPKP